VCDQKGATAVSYAVEVLTNGKSVFHRDKVTHHYLTRWRKVFALGLTEATLTPDLKPAFEAGGLPRYLALVSSEISTAEGDKFDILANGHLEPSMSAHGGRPELAPYPNWTAR